MKNHPNQHNSSLGQILNPFVKIFEQSLREIHAIKSAAKVPTGFFGGASVAVGCQKKKIKFTVYTNQNGSGGEAHMFVESDHNNQWVQLASSRSIPQEIYPPLKEWILGMLSDQISLAKKRNIIDHKESHAKYNCLIPSILGLGSRYRPTQATLRTLASEAMTQRLTDKDEANAIAKLVEDLKETKSIVYYTSGYCNCQVT